jgi:hypothetical protein
MPYRSLLVLVVFGLWGASCVQVRHHSLLEITIFAACNEIGNEEVTGVRRVMLRMSTLEVINVTAMRSLPCQGSLL